jgi:uncharacterized membrane protein
MATTAPSPISAMRFDADFFYLRGLSYHEKHDYDRAVADYSEAIRLDPNHTNALQSRAASQYEARLVEFKVCSKVGVEAVVATIGQRSPDSLDYVMEGWYSVLPGECQYMCKFARSGNVYWIANEKDGPWVWRGKEAFCISDAITKRVLTRNYTCSKLENIESFYRISINSKEWVHAERLKPRPGK